MPTRSGQWPAGLTHPTGMYDVSNAFKLPYLKVIDQVSIQNLSFCRLLVYLLSHFVSNFPNDLEYFRKHYFGVIGHP